MTDSDSQILNLRSADPFGDASGLGSLNDDKKKNEDNLGQGLIHIRIQVSFYIHLLC